MVRKMTKTETFAMILIMIMMFVNTAAANMLIPSFGTIIADFQIDRSLIYIPDSIFTLVSAIFSVIWGYYTDRLDRSKIIMGGSFLSTIGFLYTAFCNDFTGLLLARIITGMGMGCVLPVGFSILGDLVPAEERAGWFGFIAIFSSISNGAGNGMAAFLGPLDILGMSWQFPFLILTFFAVFVVVFLMFIKLPSVGSMETDLAELNKIEDLQYGYQINRVELVKMLKKPTNKYLIVSGFFSIVPGTLLIFMLITALSDPGVGFLKILPVEIRTQVSTIMAGLVGVGYLIGNASLSAIGDKLYLKNRNNRAKLAFIVQVLAIPFIILMLFQLTPLDTAFYAAQEYPVPMPSNQIFQYVLSTLFNIFRTYPSYILFFVFSFIGSFCGAGPVSAKNAVMIDVNLPEHRGTATSFFSLTEQIGKSITLLLASGLVMLFQSYVSVIGIAALFYIPAAVFWFLVFININKDLDNKAMVLKERTQMTFIDYFFELEMAIDDGVQKIQDARMFLLRDVKKSQKLIDEATDKFKLIIRKAEKRQLTEIEEKAHEKMSKALLFKNDLLMLSKNPKEKQLKDLSERVEAMWEQSDYGKLEVLYESAYLKACEARLLRHYNPFETMNILKNAIDIYERVIRLSSDRVIEEGSKKFTPEEEQFQKRVNELIVLAQKSKSNTENLRNKINSVIQTVTEKNISKEELQTLISLTSEYSLKLQDIVADSFEGKVAKEVKHLTEDIDKLFEAYDQWQTEINP